MTARALIEQGNAKFRAGDFAAARAQWTDAARQARAAGDARLEAEALGRRGELSRIEGRLSASTEDLRAALARAQPTSDARLLAALSGALGSVALAAGRPAEAEPLLRRAQGSGDAVLAASAGNDLGNLLAATGRAAAADVAYDTAAREADRAGDKVLAATAWLNRARIMPAARAAPALDQALRLLAQAPATHAAGFALVATAHVALDHGARAQAARALAGAEGMRVADPALAAEILGAQGRLAQTEARLADAARLTETARLRATEAGIAELAFRLDWQLAAIRRAQGDHDAALPLYRRAAAGLAEFRGDIPLAFRDGRSSFRDGYGPLYQQLADMLLTRAAARPAEAPALLDETRASQERLKQAELADLFRDGCVAAWQARSRGIEGVAADTAVLYPVPLPGRLELLLSFGGRQHRVAVPVTESSLRREAEAFRRALEDRATYACLEPARRLYALLIAPVLPLLSGARALVVVPDGALRLFPFAALHDGGQYLAEHLAVATAPGLSLVDPRPVRLQGMAALAAGISEAIGGYAQLPAVRDEIAAVGSARGATVLLDRGFTRESFSRALAQRSYGVVHIASHGEFGADAGDSFVLAHDGRLTLDALEALVKAGRFRDQALELLVLSACQTAAGDDRAALGLAGLAVKAGARSAVASLWNVSDVATGLLVREFYRALDGGAGKAAALAAAQRALLADPLLAHPAYWSPFLLVGNWL